MESEVGHRNRLPGEASGHQASQSSRSSWITLLVMVSGSAARSRELDLRVVFTDPSPLGIFCDSKRTRPGVLHQSASENQTLP